MRFREHWNSTVENLTLTHKEAENMLAMFEGFLAEQVQSHGFRWMGGTFRRRSVPEQFHKVPNQGDRRVYKSARRVVSWRKVVDKDSPDDVWLMGVPETDSMGNPTGDHVGWTAGRFVDKTFVPDPSLSGFASKYEEISA